jgi:hypothetical protein
MGVLDKVRKFKSKSNDGGGGRTMGIWHEWKDGDNHIRLVGEFLKVKTHFLAGAKARGERGLCQDEAFDKNNDNRIPVVVNCPNWDIEKEEDKDVKTCPIDKLYKIALQALDENPDDDEKKYFEALKDLSRPREGFKWLIFDRDNPNVTHIDESNNKTEKKGLKIATIGKEAWNDICGIFEQCGFDITDAQEGIDINVIKGHNGTRVSYSAQAVLDGKGLKVTPFDEEEQVLVENAPDLKALCGKQTSPDVIRDALHGDYFDVLEMNDDDGNGNGPAASATEEVDTDDDALVPADSKKK